jgi:hypothetical protein
MATSFSGGGSRSTWREPPTMGKQLENFITCGCESSAPFFVIYKAGCRLFSDKSNKRSIKLETAVTWSKSNLNMMNIYEESTINFWIWGGSMS